VTIGDTEPFALPRPEHQIAAHELQRREDEAKWLADENARLVAVKKKRRTILYTSFVVGLTATLLLPAVWYRLTNSNGSGTATSGTSTVLPAKSTSSATSSSKA
jgi:hypothetical protein